MNITKNKYPIPCRLRNFLLKIPLRVKAKTRDTKVLKQPLKAEFNDLTLQLTRWVG